MIILDVVIFYAGWLLGLFVFRGYAAHVTLTKQLTKIVLLSFIFWNIHYFGGRSVYYSVLVAMAGAMAILHGYWFHIRHGIHWRTAQPRDKYLRLIGHTKQSKNL